MADSKHTVGDLRQLQSLPLRLKIMLTQQRIQDWYDHWNGQVYVSFSGGKDSTVLTTTGLSRTGCMFCMLGVHLEKEPNRFQRMKVTHPKQYAYCMDKLGLREVLEYIGVPYE